MRAKVKHILFFALLAGCLSPFAFGEGEEPHKYTLKECINYAYEHSPSLAKQEITVRNQKLQTVIAEASFEFKLSGSYSHDVKDGADDDSLTLSKEFQSGFAVKSWVSAQRRNGEGFTSSYIAVQLSKTLLGGGSRLETTYDIEASLLDELSALNTCNRARRKLAQDIKIAYYNVIQAQQSLLVKKRALENAKHTLALTIEREKPLDILTAEIRIPENELSVNTAERSIKNGLDSLKELMGMDINAEFDITGEFDYLEQNFNLADDLDFGRENLETFLNNRLEHRKLEWQEKIYKDKVLPTVSVAATHYKYMNGASSHVHSGEEQVLSVNLNYNLGIKAERARLAQTRNRLESNKHDYFILDQELTSSLTSYHRRLLESAGAVKLQEKICEFQRRKEELYRDKWENGEIDILELVRTQTDLENSYVDLIDRKITYLELVANYEYTVGR